MFHNPGKDAVKVDLSKVTDVDLSMIAAYAGIGGATLEGTILTIDAKTSVVLR